jgi:hypothetical protein
MANGFDSLTLEAILAPQTQALQALAMRPQKTSADTTTTSTSTPYALEDLVATRNRIGESTKALDDALKARETFGYTLANALAGAPQQQGAGSWLSDFARGFGGGMSARTNAAVDRAQKKYEAEMKDLADILAFDKAMGETTTQTQNQVIGYTPMEYGTAGGTKTASGQGAGSLNGVQQNNFGRSVGYDPVENLPDFGPVTRAALSEEQLGVMKYLPYAQAAAKGLTDKTATELQSTWSDISDNILSGRVLDFVGKAGGVRVADTPAEQEFIFGPIRNYRNMSKRQLQAGLKQARNNFVAAGLNKARQQGIEVSEDELKTWWNSAFSVPEGRQTGKMYNVQNPPVEKAKEQITISVGEVRNGYRFKGGDPKKKENWEAI